jgi:hypothetical protein
MTNTDELKNIFNKIQVLDVIKKDDFEKIVQDKITKFIPIVQNKRWTKKFILNLTLAYNKDPLYVSLSAKKCESGIYALKNINNPYFSLAKDIADEQIRFTLSNYIFPDEKNKVTYRALENIWTNNDLKDLEKICLLYSDPETVAFHYFETKFKEDGRIAKLAQKLNKATKSSLYEITGLCEFHSFIKCIANENNLKSGLIVKKDDILQNSYVEFYHPTKYSAFNLYLPYSQVTLGWSDHGVPYRLQVANLQDKDEALENLAEYCKFIEAVPTAKEIDFPIFRIKDTITGFHKWLKVPTNAYWQKNFGELKFALIEAGILNNNNQNSKYGIYCIAKDGHNCRSRSEQIIDNFLYENGIKHTPEPLYPQDDEFNPTGKMRADWLINNDVYVEFFGLMQDQKYREKRDKKVSLAKKLNIKLIEIYDINYLEKDFNEFLNIT